MFLLGFVFLLWYVCMDRVVTIQSRRAMNRLIAKALESLSVNFVDQVLALMSIFDTEYIIEI